MDILQSLILQTKLLLEDYFVVNLIAALHLNLTQLRENVTLGTASGGLRYGIDVDLLHPCQSPYNLYTWAE